MPNTTRLNPRHQDMVRQKIQASQIVNRLQSCIDGKVELSAVQVSAARILLDKSIATLTAVDLTAADAGGLNLSINLSRQPAAAPAKSELRRKRK